MVSSTFYDLKQVRQDIYSFLVEQLGYQALLSELPAFPVAPDLDTIANCQKRVREQADVLVLIVGGRYGSIDDKTSKSVTNLEYLAAREKGIPVYAFVESRILNVLPVWKANQEADFSSVTDTSELFRFISTVRDEDKVWVFPFDGAQDIVRTLRSQFAHRFSEGLGLAARLRGASLPRYLRDLGPAALRTALEKPDAWEWRLFFEAWQDEVDSRVSQLRDHSASIAIGLAENVNAAEAIEWIRTRMHEMSTLVDTLNHLIKVEAKESFGEPGVPGNAEHIVWTTRKVGEALDCALAWSHRIRLARVEEPFHRPAKEMALFVNDLIDQIVAFPQAKLDQISQALIAAAADPDTPQEMRFTLTITLSNLQPFLDALDEAEGQI
ncbi:MAG: DUF4062 domain-containing protein [Vicinamibacterales bacterium]